MPAPLKNKSWEEKLFEKYYNEVNPEAIKQALMNKELLPAYAYNLMNNPLPKRKESIDFGDLIIRSYTLSVLKSATKTYRNVYIKNNIEAMSDSEKTKIYADLITPRNQFELNKENMKTTVGKDILNYLDNDNHSGNSFAVTFSEVANLICQDVKPYAEKILKNI